MASRKSSSDRTRRDAEQNAIFGHVLRALRQQRNYTQKELAQRCDMDPTFISRLELGYKEPCLNTIIRLGESLEVPVAEIMAAVEAEMQRAARS